MANNMKYNRGYGYNNRQDRVLRQGANLPHASEKRGKEIRENTE